MDQATFRSVYREFADVGVYPPEQVQFWLTAASSRLDGLRWGDLLDQGTALFVAHNLALRPRPGARVASTVSGPVASKSVGGVSVSYDTASSAIENAGAYNLTIYGKGFWQLAMMVGSGGVQL